MDLEPWREGVLFDERDDFPTILAVGPFVFLGTVLPLAPTLLLLAGFGLEESCFRALELVFLDAPLLELDEP